MEKLDLTKKYKSYYRAGLEPELVEIEPAQFLSITGKGDPNGNEFADHTQALFATAFNLKFTFKEKGKDFVVAKLEGLWWFDESKYPSLIMTNASIKVPRNEWEYRLLIRLPDFVSESEVRKSVESVVVKKALQSAERIEFYEMSEGNCVQMLHIGPFSTEPEGLAKIADFVRVNNLQQNGKHHEIYLSDFRKTAPEKLKTILREPVRF